MEKDWDGGAYTDGIFGDSGDEAVIDAILEEAKYYAEKEKAERRAKLFVGDNAAQIFSTAEKTVRTTNTNPLDLTGEFPINAASSGKTEESGASSAQTPPPSDGSRTEDLKVEATMRAARLMETPDEYEMQEEDFLNPDRASPSAKGASLPQDKPQAEEAPSESAAGEYEKIFGIHSPRSKRESEFIHYAPGGAVMQIPLRNAKFSDTVRGEYEEFMREAEKEQAEERAAMQEKQKQKQTVGGVRRMNSSFVTKLMDFFSTGEEDEIDSDGEPPYEEPEEEPIADYDEKGEEKNIFDELNFRLRSTSFKAALLLLLALISGSLAILCSAIPEKISGALMNAPVVYAVINLVITVFAIVISLSTITNGLVPLVRFKGNSDTAVAVACILCAVQSVSALFASEEYFSGTYSLYTAALLLALFANALGKRIMVKRIRENFKFITSRRANYAVGLYEEEKLSKEMTAGTAVNDPVIAYQHRSGFLNDFLKLSYAQDKCELVCSRLAPVTFICSLVLGVLYAVLKHSFFGGIASCAVVAVISVPVCNMLVVNLPLRSFGKELLRKNAMLSGYPAFMKFSQTNAVVVDACELYSNGVSLRGLKTFETLRGDEAFVCAAAVLKEAKSPLYFAFSGFLSKQKDIALPKVESWVYEENLGLVAWVNNERVIIGSREIMSKYGVKLPPIGYEEKEKKKQKREITFIAFSGEAVAMLSLKYTPKRAMLTELQRAEMNGISILVSSSDCNITQEKVAGDFDIYYRSVKILSPGHTAVAREKAAEAVPRSRAYLATKGGAASMLRALSGCLKLRSAIHVGIVLQVVSVILGILLLATLCLFSSVSFITAAGVIIYMVFWFAAIIIAQKIHRP